MMSSISKIFAKSLNLTANVTNAVLATLADSLSINKNCIYADYSLKKVSGFVVKCHLCAFLKEYNKGTAIYIEFDNSTNEILFDEELKKIICLIEKELGVYGSFSNLDKNDFVIFPDLRYLPENIIKDNVIEKYCLPKRDSFNIVIKKLLDLHCLYVNKDISKKEFNEQIKPYIEWL